MYISNGNRTELANNLTSICFTVQAKPLCAFPNSPCCQFQLYKAEFEVAASCNGSLSYTSVDGVRKMPFFQKGEHPVIKVNNINKPFAAVAGTEICLFLKPQCNTLESLGAFGDGTISVALFNVPGTIKPTDCCPLTTVE